MVYAATKQVISELQEIAIAQAALAADPNATAITDYDNSLSADSESKMNRAGLIRLPLITQAIIDKFGNFKIKLVEYNENNHMAYVNYFVFDCIVLLDDNFCVFKGEISIGGKPYSIGFTRYLFSENKWQRVRCGAALKITEISQIEPFNANMPLVNEITSFIKELLKEGKTTAMTGSLITRKPLSRKANNNLYGDYLNAYRKKKAITPMENI